MKLSIIIPAFNEAKRIASCLQHLSSALRANARSDLESEIIVVDNNSIDATAEIARNLGARVLFEPLNQIARARNAGASVATGDFLLFVDADTHVSADTLAEMLAFIDSATCVGGGTVLRYDKQDLVARCFLFLSNPIVRWLKLTPGCFIFCRGEVFRALGGFSQEMFAGEDADFGWRLRLSAGHLSPQGGTVRMERAARAHWPLGAFSPPDRARQIPSPCLLRRAEIKTRVTGTTSSVRV